MSEVTLAGITRAGIVIAQPELYRVWVYLDTAQEGPDPDGSYRLRASLSIWCAVCEGEVSRAGAGNAIEANLVDVLAAIAAHELPGVCTRSPAGATRDADEVPEPHPFTARDGQPDQCGEWVDEGGGSRLCLEPPGHDLHTWRPGFPCGQCGSTNTGLDPADGPTCNGCGATDADEG